MAVYLRGVSNTHCCSFGCFFSLLILTRPSQMLICLLVGNERTLSTRKTKGAGNDRDTKASHLSNWFDNVQIAL